MGLVSEDSRRRLSVDFKSSCSQDRRLIVKIKAPKMSNDESFVTGVVFRDYVRENLAKGLSRAAEEVGDGGHIVAELAEFIETNLNSDSAWGLLEDDKKDVIEKKKAKYRTLLNNLKDPKNPDFRKKVLCGIFPPKKISTLTYEDMASEAKKLQRQKIEADLLARAFANA